VLRKKGSVPPTTRRREAMIAAGVRPAAKVAAKTKQIY
jgi:hypothetical protein